LIDLTKINFSTLSSFCAIYEEKTVTSAARKLAKTQPTISHALAVLRERCDDELFVNSGVELVPTELAKEIYPFFKTALQALRKAENIGKISEFDFSSHTYTLGASDYYLSIVAPRILDSVYSYSESFQLEYRHLGNVKNQIDYMVSLVLSGKLDAIVHENEMLSDGFKRKSLLKDEWVLFASKHYCDASISNEEAWDGSALAETRRVDYSELAYIKSGCAEVDDRVLDTYTFKSVVGEVPAFSYVVDQVLVGPFVSVVPSNIIHINNSLKENVKILAKVSGKPFQLYLHWLDERTNEAPFKIIKDILARDCSYLSTVG